MATTINIPSGVTSSGFIIGNDTIANIYGTALYFDIQTSGLMNVYSGGSAKGTELEAGGAVMVSGGGTISDTLVYAGADINGFTIGSNYYMSAFSVMDASVGNTASAWLFNGQTASSVEVNSGGVLTVSSGASITTLQVSAGAELKILGGAVAKDVSMEAGTVLNGFTLQVLTNDIANVSSAVTNTSGAVYSGRKVTSAAISQGGNVSVFGGGVLSSAVNSGVLFISSGGYLKDAVNSGTVNIFGGTGVQVANHALLSVSSGGLVSGMTQFAGGSMNVDNSGFVSSAVISGGSVVVSAGGSMDQVQMTAGSMYVSGGAVENFGITNAYVSVGNISASNSIIIGAASGLLSSASIGSGGRVNLIYGELKDVTVESAGSMWTVWGNSITNLLISSGGSVSAAGFNDYNNLTLLSGGALNGFTAVNTNVIASGLIHRDVVVSSSSLAAELYMDEQVSKAVVKSGGTIHIGSDNWAHVASAGDLTVERGGTVAVDEDAVLVLNGKTILNDGGGIVLSRHIIHYADKYKNAVDLFKGVVDTACYTPVGSSVTATISGYLWSRASATADWGSAGTLTKITVNPYLANAGYTNNYFPASYHSETFGPLNGMSSDGLQRVTGGSLISSTEVEFGSQARIRFDFTSTTLAPNEAMLNDISRVSVKDTGVDSSTLVPNQFHDDPRFEFVYNSNLKDAYFIADGAEGFGVYFHSALYPTVYSETFRIVDAAGNALVSNTADQQQLNVGGNIVNWNDAGVTVSARLQKEDSHLSLELYRNDASSSAEITVSPYSTKYTNADVVLTAQFSQNTQFDTKIYNVDFNDGTSRNGFYKIYEGVVFDKNGTVTFGGVGADGNLVTETVTVDWIDKLAPVITAEQSMPSGETIYSVTVTASAADVISPYYALSGLDEERGIQYSFTGLDDDWQPYSGSGVVVEHNGKVYFRAWDNAGNMGTQEVNVTNIVKDPKTPEIFSVSPTTLTNGTVSITVKFDPEAQENQVSTNGVDYVQLTTERFGTFEAEENGTYYFRSKYAVPGVYSNAQTYTVTNIDKTKPLAPVVTIEPEDVVLSAVLTAEYHELDSAKEYSLDYNPDSGIGNWQAYTDPITVTANLTYYFRETDLAGNQSDVTPFKVTSIAVANAPAATVDKTELTKDPVHITVSPVTGTTLPMTYQYKFIEKDGSESDWIVFSPSASVITVDKNKTVKIRAVETADPDYSSLVTTVEVNNIDSLPPTIEKINYSRLDPNSWMTVSVISTDDIIGGVAKTEYTFDGGSSWTAFESVDIGDNQFKGAFELSAESLPFGFQVKVTDLVGNVTFSPEYVINNLVIIPSSLIWTKDDVTLTVKASDQLFGVKGLEYSFDSGSIWNPIELTEKGGVYTGTLTLEQNESILFRVTDNDDNVFTFVPYVYSLIDKVSPTIDSITGYDVWSNTSITVDVTASDDYSGVAKTYYSFDGSDWNEFPEGSFTLTENGPFQVKVVDNAGNETTSPHYNIKTIDRLAPVIDAVDYSDAWTNGNVTVSVTAHDEEDAENKASGIGKMYYMFNETEWTEFEGSFTLTENGSFQVKVVDNAGNETLSSGYDIETIDRLAPVIDAVDYSDAWTKGNVTVSVTAHDQPEDEANKSSGIGKMYYTFNGTGWEEFEGSFELTENGPFMVKVVDNAGNETLSSVYNIKTIDRLAPVIDEVDYSDAWTNGNVTVSVTASDFEDAENKASGVAKTYYSFDGSPWTEFEGSFELSENGPFQVKVVDNAGNETTSQHYNIKTIDRLAPVIDAVDYSDAWTNGNVTVSVTAHDQPENEANKSSGIGKMYYTFNGSAWTAFTDSFTLTENGPFMVKVLDNAGNETTSGSYSVTNIDKVAPVIDSVSWNEGWTNEDVTVTVSASDALSGVSTTEYSYDGGAWTLFTDTFIVSGNGTFQVRVTDNAGNVTISDDYEVMNIDKVAPVIDSVNWNEAWTNEDVTVTVSASDALSGVSTTEYSYDGGAWTLFTDTFVIENSGPFRVRVTDNAGNTVIGDYVITNIDKIAPVIGSVTSNMTDWTNTDVTLTINATDEGGSGVVLYQYLQGETWTDLAGNTYVADKNGNYKFRVFDGAGNVSDEFTKAVGNIDKVAPTAEISLSPTAWTNGMVTVTVTAADDLSGVSTTEYSLDGGASWKTYTEPFTVESNCNIMAKVTDNAGNVKVEEAAIGNIDKIAPVIDSVSWNTAWTNVPVTVSVSASDDASGVKTTEYSFDGGTNWTAFTDTFTLNENGTFNVRVTDNAGNVKVSDAYSVTNIDTIAPLIGLSTDTSKQNPVIVTVSPTDNLSGVAKVEYSINGSSWAVLPTTGGSINVTENGVVNVRALDNAGNINSVSEYFYDVPSVVRRDGPTTFKVAVSGTYSITGDFGNISGLISVTNNDTTINGTIKQGVLTIGTGNQIPLSPAEATVQVTVTNGSLYPYNIFFYSDVVPTPAVSNDLNDDGRADVLMSIAQSGHPAYGSTGAWFIQENQTPLWSDLSQYGSGWEIFGFGTVAAGKATDDVYLRSSGNVVGAWVTGLDGKVSFWQTIGEFDSSTQIVGLGDFNGDGKTDLLLRNNNGAVGSYFTNGQGWKEFKSIGSEWKLSAIGDLNGDGLDDVVLKHDNGFAGTWLTQTDGTVAWADLDTLPAGFEIIGAGDFNGDGTDDVLLRNGTYFGAWLVNKGNAVGWMGLGDLGSVSVEQIADFNGDGKDDLRIRTAGNEVGVQLVLGTDTLDWKYYGAVGSEWSTSLAALN